MSERVICLITKPKSSMFEKENYITITKLSYVLKMIPVLLVFSCFSLIVNSQSIQYPVSTSEKARYLSDDLTIVLSNNVAYPKEAFMENKLGDVILSFIINKEGKMDSLTVSSSPDFSLSTSSIVSFDIIENNWSPAKIDSIPIDKKYLIVFRYRIYINSSPTNYKAKAKECFEKENYQKSLKAYNKAIKDNQYDFELFELRSNIKELMGDSKGAAIDSLNSTLLKNEIMAVINIVGIGVTKFGVVKSKIEYRRIHENYYNKKPK